MARPLRIEFARALYLVTARGNARQKIYADDADRKFLKLLAHAVDRYDWCCHAYCLMGKHSHPPLETGTPSLAKSMRLLNGSYTQHYNHWYNSRRLQSTLGYWLAGQSKTVNL